MVPWRGLRDQLAANRDASGLGEFAASLLAVLEDPAIADSVADAVTMSGTRRRRNAGSVTPLASLRDTRNARLAGREGRRRG